MDDKKKKEEEEVRNPAFDRDDQAYKGKKKAKKTAELAAGPSLSVSSAASILFQLIRLLSRL